MPHEKTTERSYDCGAKQKPDPDARTHVWVFSWDAAEPLPEKPQFGVQLLMSRKDLSGNAKADFSDHHGFAEPV